MRSASYNMERRAHETWKEYNVEKMEYQSTSSEKMGHSHKWMKKTKQLGQNGIHESSSILILF